MSAQMQTAKLNTKTLRNQNSLVKIEDLNIIFLTQHIAGGILSTVFSSKHLARTTFSINCEYFTHKKKFYKAHFDGDYSKAEV